MSVQSEILALIPDNTTGQVSPADVRAAFDVIIADKISSDPALGDIPGTAITNAFTCTEADYIAGTPIAGVNYIFIG